MASSQIKDWEKDAKWSGHRRLRRTLGQGAKAQAFASPANRDRRHPYAERLEDDRSFGQEELKSAGVSIIPTKISIFDPAIEFVKKNPTLRHPNQREAQNVKRRLFVGKKKTAKTSSACSRLQESLLRRDQSVFNCSAASTASKSLSALSSTARNLSAGQHQLSSTKNLPGEVGPPPARWARYVLERANLLFSRTLPNGVQARRGRLRRLHRPQTAS